MYILLGCAARLLRRSPVGEGAVGVSEEDAVDADSLAVLTYALAALFNRRKEEQAAGGGSSLLVLLWAPILLMHIGGHGVITAYTIEDNELWMRHVVTAFSQIAVAVYVFCKSWPAIAGDKLLLGAAVLLFLQGADECIWKPYRLRFGTVDVECLVMSLDPTPRTTPSSISSELELLNACVRSLIGLWIHV